MISFAADNDGTGIYFMKGSSLMRNWKNKILLIMSMVMVLCLFIVPFAYSEECGIGTAASCEKVTDTEDIPYETEYRLDTNRYPESGNKLIQAGQNGIKNCNYRITYENGIKTGRYDLGVEITEPVKEIISIPGKEHIIETKEETVTEPVAFSTETVDDPDRIKGDPDIVLQEGQNGVKTIVYTVTYTDGVETGRTVKSETVTTQPVNEIISVAVGKYTVSYETMTEIIPFETVYIDTENMCAGEEYAENEGQDGEKEVTYQIKKDKDGKEVSRSVYAEKITQDVVNKIIYRGTFVPVVTYTVVDVPDLPECDPLLRDSGLNAACTEWAMKMAKSNTVKHSDLGHGESVGGWGSIDEVVYGREYSEINPDNGQVYGGNTSLGSHGGEGLANGHRWGAGCVARSETQPDGSVVTVYFACARSEL